MSIFEAHYFPGGPNDLPDSITPVNLARALYDRDLGTTLPRLPDLSFFSTPSRPCALLTMPPEASGGSGSRR